VNGLATIGALRVKLRPDQSWILASLQVNPIMHIECHWAESIGDVSANDPRF
jgi:hypothetical protein